MALIGVVLPVLELVDALRLVLSDVFTGRLVAAGAFLDAKLKNDWADVALIGEVNALRLVLSV